MSSSCRMPTALRFRGLRMTCASCSCGFGMATAIQVETTNAPLPGVTPRNFSLLVNALVHRHDSCQIEHGRLNGHSLESPACPLPHLIEKCPPAPQIVPPASGERPP